MFLTMPRRNYHFYFLPVVATTDTSEFPLLFVRVDGWDPHKIQIGKKMFLYVT